MPRLDFISDSARESILFSEERPTSHARLGRRSVAPRRLNLCCWRTKHFHESEEGMLTLATVITVLGLVVLIAFLGNIGETVVEKIEMQNDADVAAYSTALWMARGMNAVTTTNHLLGELTALCVLHESFGGPELDEVAKRQPAGWDVAGDVKSLNQQIRFLKEPAPVTKYSPYWFFLQKVHPYDYKLVEFAIDRIAADNEKFKAGAMIYDAKLTIKRQLLSMLELKAFANAGYFVPPYIMGVPVGVATMIAASITHLYASGEIVLLTKEWLILEIIQTAAIAMSGIKTNIIEPQLIPAMVTYGDQVAELNGGGSVLLRPRVEAALQELDGRRGTQLSTFPAPRDLQLPLVKEPAPATGGQPLTATAQPLDDTHQDDAFKQQMTNMQNSLSNASNRDKRPDTMKKVNDLSKEIRELKQKADKLEAEKKADAEKLKADAEQAKKDNKPVPEQTPEEKAADQARDKEIQDSKEEQAKLTKEREELIAKLKVMGKNDINGQNANANNTEMSQEQLDDTDPDKNKASEDVLKYNAQFKDPAQLEKEVAKLEGLDRDMGQILKDPDAALTGTERSNLELAQKQVQRELDERRKELDYARQSDGEGKKQSLSNLGGQNPSSKNLGKVRLNEEQEKVTQWMRAAYPHMAALRGPILGMLNSMVPKSKAANSYKYWTDRYSIIKPFHFRAGKKWTASGGLPELSPNGSFSKGPQHMYVLKDTYPKNGVVSRKGLEPWRKGVDPAEKYFTVIGFAYRPAHDGLFADVLFKSAHPAGNLALSQAIVYNANLETPVTSTQTKATQPDVGWDTLNWETPVKAPEHGHGGGENGFLWPWQLFSSNSAMRSDQNKVKLNWQAKLVPVTETRARSARNNSNVPGGVRKVLDRSKKNFDSLIQH